MSKVEEALALFYGNYNCSQSVFSVFAEQLGIEKELALRIACGFGAGMARKQLTCGAVTAANMVIGLKYGNYTDNDLISKDKTYQLIDQFMTEFEQIHHSVDCRILTNCDFGKEQGLIDFKEKDVQLKICSNCINTSIRILEKILKNN